MPPKGKAEQKQAKKVIEDHTFGLKNKNKSKQVQKQVQALTQQVMQGNVSQNKLMEQQQLIKMQKKKEEEEKALLASLFKSVNTAQPKKVEVEEEEKSNDIKVCEFFKQGLCQKGKKCKFSHDSKKNEVIDIYTDQRDQLYNKEEEETMENWDEQKLQTVINQQQSKYKNQNPTQIICKFFLNAVEQGKYGWKWLCPNGMNCIYKHCLPPGYVLKKNVAKQEEGEQIQLEEQLEQERAALKHDQGTPVTLARFLEWKEKKRLQKEQEEERKEKEKMQQNKKKGLGVMTGRNLFQYDPTLFEDDADAVDDDAYNDRNDEDEDDENVNENNKQIKINKDEDEDGEQDEVAENWEDNKNIKINQDVFLNE